MEEVIKIKKRSKFVFILFIIIVFMVPLLIPIFSQSESQKGETITETIEDTNDVLLNPGKGFVFYARRLTYDGKHLLNSVSSEILDLSQVVYTRYDWSELQTAENEYNFDLIEESINDCIQYNKKFAFGVMCANSSSSSQYVTPQFVFEDGAEYDIATYTESDGEEKIQYIPKWEDETFLKHLNAFVQELGKKYNGNPNIAFIDIRSYGNFGEQHLFGLPVDDNYNWKARIDAEFFKVNYVEPYMESFPDTLLVNPWGNDKFNSVYEELLDKGVTLRRDGIITYTNGLDFCAKAYGKLPVIFEYAKSYSDEEYTKEYFNQRLEEALDIAKPSYIELDKKWYADGNQEYCRELANRIGYYFKLKEASYQNKITLGENTNITLDFANDGIAPLYENCKVYIALLNSDNELVRKYETEINPKNWEPETISKENISLSFDNIDIGKYKLAVGLFKNETDENPTYLLGSEGKTENNWYVFGEFDLLEKNNDNENDNQSNYSEKIMKNPPSITKVQNEEELENTTIWYKSTEDKETINPVYKSYNSNLEALGTSKIIGHNNIFSATNKWPNLYSVEFTVNCKEFFINTCTSYRILVDEGNGYEITDRDGIKQTLDDTSSETDKYKGVWHKVSFDEKKERNIKVELTDCHFRGIRLYEEDEIKPIERESNKKVLFVGSSITRGANYEAYYSWPNVLSNILNLECMNNGVGGSGFLANSSGKNYAYYDRVVQLLDELNPDVVVLEAGPNDYWSDYTSPEILEQVNKCYNYIKNNSNAKIITIGVYYPSFYIPEGALDINNELKENAIEHKVPFIDLLTGDTYNEKGEKITFGTSPYITGSGDTGKPHNDGNADIYVCEDNVHLSIEGNKYFGEKLAVEFKKLLKEAPTPQVPLDGTDIVSLYCWDIDDFNLSKLKDEIDYLKVNTLYVQKPANQNQTDRLKQIMEFAKQNELDVFLLNGATDWLTTGDMNNVTSLIDEAYELNKTLDYKLKGVSLDVEFYLTEDYQNADTDKQIELFKTFTENTKKCCDYANSLDLEYSMALPVWLDKLSEETLEDLMNYNYDHIAFMNYFKETIMQNLDEEVEIARNHNIKIVTIAEVQNPEKGTVGEEDSFYNDGLQTCIDTLNNIKQKYNCENLGISYHYYMPLLDLLERDTDVEIDNKYELEVYPYVDGKSVKADEIEIVGTDTKPITGYYNESDEHIVNFYGLEYGKEYTITIKSGNYTGTKTFTYQKGDKDFNKFEIAYTSLDLKEIESPDPDTPDPDNPNPDPGTDTPDPDSPEPNPGTDTPDPDNPDTPDNPDIPDTPEIPKINTDDLGYKTAEQYIKEVKPKTPIQDFKEILLNGLEYSVEIADEKDGVEVTEGYVKTGMYAKIVDENGNTLKNQDDNPLEFQIVVTGDITGDGIADALDFMCIKSHRAEVVILEGISFQAGDLNFDGNVDAIDSKLLLLHRAEVQGYDLNYTK